MDSFGSAKNVLILPYPLQGHINPLLQLAKRLASKGMTPSIAITHYIANSMPSHIGPVAVEAISDGFDDMGFAGADSIHAYLETFRIAGSKTLSELIGRYNETGRNICSLVYDAVLPWALDVAKEKGLYAAAFFTQCCAVNSIYYHEYSKKLPNYEAEADHGNTAISLPGLALLDVKDLPSFLSVPGSYPAYKALVLNQFSNLEKADCVLVNTFYELEIEELNWMSGLYPTKAVGLTVPSMYLEKRIEGDKEHELSLWKPDGEVCINWLNSKEPGSVVYVSFGSMAELDEDQMEELAKGFDECGHPCLWVVRETQEKKLSPEFWKSAGSQHLIVRWAPQLEVLAHPAVGCFVTHCGWNSTIEALCVGVPMVGMPQWTDQPTNAKYVEDVWGVGVRVTVDAKGLVRMKEIVRCIEKVTRDEMFKKNCLKWMNLAREAVDEGGSSDQNIEEFVKEISEGFSSSS